MARRPHLTLTLLVVAFFFSISYFYAGPASARAQDAARLLKSVRDGAQSPLSQVSASFEPAAVAATDGGLDSLLEGESIEPKLENATLKAELGRATWKFLHTMVAKYPENPSPEDRKTLELFFLTFGKLYPCGDCARHFRGLLKKMPPQTSSRNAAAGWLCEMHNRVTLRRNHGKKDAVFDCSKIGDFYDCGCADDKNKDKSGKAGDEDSKGK